MSHSPKPVCGKCGLEYQPTRGGWSGRHIVRSTYPGLRAGAQEGDPLHDKCYKSIHRLMVRRIA
jgi:hypothetical protein